MFDPAVASFWIVQVKEPETWVSTESWNWHIGGCGYVPQTN